LSISHLYQPWLMSHTADISTRPAQFTAIRLRSDSQIHCYGRVNTTNYKKGSMIWRKVRKTREDNSFPYDLHGLPQTWGWSGTTLIRCYKAKVRYQAIKSDAPIGSIGSYSECCTQTNAIAQDRLAIISCGITSHNNQLHTELSVASYQLLPRSAL
jgi:hypothetical protein